MASSPLISMCDPQLCNNSQACCAATIFSVLLILFLVSVFSPSPSSILALIACPHPHCLPSPSLLALALIIHPCPHPSLPSSLVTAIAAASSCQCADSQRQHTGINASPVSLLEHSRIFGIAASPSLSSVTWGTFPNLARRHCSALQFTSL